MRILLSLAAAATLAASASAATPFRATLRITYWPHGQSEGGQVAATIRCPAAGAACTVLAAHAGALGPAQRPCTLMLIRGTPQALFTGTVAGRRVNRLLNPACDRAAWTALQPLLPAG